MPNYRYESRTSAGKVNAGVISAPDLAANPVDLPAGGLNLEEAERRLVVQALERTGWNQTRAAKLLGLNRDQIRYRIEKFKLENPSAAQTGARTDAD